MLRKISGSGFAAAMILIIALKHAALGFCLCTDRFIVSECDCESPQPANEQSCGCCLEDSSQTPPAEPCDDCVVAVSLDPGDFLWSADSFQPSEEIGGPVALPFGLNDQCLPHSIVHRAAHPIRGSPPGCPPLFLRTRVLRL